MRVVFQNQMYLDSNFSVVLKDTCEKFHQARNKKTVDLYEKQTHVKTHSIYVYG